MTFIKHPPYASSGVPSRPGHWRYSFLLQCRINYTGKAEAEVNDEFKLNCLKFRKSSVRMQTLQDTWGYSVILDGISFLTQIL